MKCPKCNTNNPDTLKFCGECGTQLPSIDGIEVTETLETPKEELTRGTIFAGRYEIIEELGKGGMGRVYRVEDIKTREEIALKLIKPEFATDKKTIERFRNELTSARKITHKNVCRMYDLGEEKGLHFITMEYILGQDLKGLIRQTGQLTVSKAISIAKQICDGLTEAHNLGVVHRDLKPNNIMIDRGGNAKIMDFGIARAAKGKGITGSGVMIGTPQYMSPEQVGGKEVDQRSDIYSLGIILYEMLTTQLPFEGDTPLTIGVKQKTEMPRDPKELNEQIPDGLSRVILKCLAKDREDRYQSTEDVKSDLEKLEQGLPTTDRIVPKKKPLTSREITVQFSMKKIYFPALAVIALAVIALIIWSPWSNKTAIPIPSDKPSLAVLYFENNTGDEDLDYLRRALSLLITTDLGQSKFIRVLSDDLVYNYLQKLSLLESSAYSSEDLSSLAELGRVDYFVTGSLTKLGGQFRLTSSLKKPGEVEAIQLSDLRCGDLEELAPQIDKLSEEIKNALDLSPEQIASDIDRAIGAVTTSSPEAYKLYIQAAEFLFQLKNTEAIPLLEKALEYDPDFVLAYHMLAAAYGNAGFASKAYEYKKRAFDLRDRVTDRTKYRIEGDFYMLKEETYTKSFKAYEKLLELYPDDTTGNNMLGLLYDRIGEWDKAIKYRKVNADNNVGLWLYHAALLYEYRKKGFIYKAREVALNYLNKYGELASIYPYIADTYILEGNLDLALGEVDKAFVLEPSNPTNQFYRAVIHLYRDNYEAAEKEFRNLCDSHYQAVQHDALRRFAALSLYKGQYLNAIEYLYQALTAAEKLGEEEWIFDTKQRLIRVYIRMERYQEAENLLQNVFSDSGSMDISVFQRAHEESQARLKAEMGDLESAQIHANELKRLIENSLHTKLIRDYYAVQALIELKLGNYSNSIEFCENAIPLFPDGPRATPAFVLNTLGQAYINLNQLDEAKKTYENLINLTWGRFGFGDIYCKSFYHLGTIFEKKDDPIKAIEHYEKFLTLWKDADPGIAEVEDAKKRLAGLKSQ
jgi:serine/threonine protein kinase/Tfp pilus assembly protein PilF